MAKGSKSIFFCPNCGHEEAKWLGQCPACGEWNSFVEEKIGTGISKGSTVSARTVRDAAPVSLSKVSASILYISGEESQTQIKLRANRMGEFAENLLLLCETNLGIIRAVIEKETPELVIIDSIQTM